MTRRKTPIFDCSELGTDKVRQPGDPVTRGEESCSRGVAGATRRPDRPAGPPRSQRGRHERARPVLGGLAPASLAVAGAAALWAAAHGIGSWAALERALLTPAPLSGWAAAQRLERSVVGLAEGARSGPAAAGMPARPARDVSSQEPDLAEVPAEGSHRADVSAVGARPAVVSAGGSGPADVSAEGSGPADVSAGGSGRAGASAGRPGPAGASPLAAASAGRSLARRLAVRRGLAWLARYFVDDGRLGAAFSDYVVLLGELARGCADVEVREVAAGLLQDAFERGRGRLAALFPADAEGKRDFVSVLDTLDRHRGPLEAYLGFYREAFAAVPWTEPGAEGAYEAAAARLDYDALGDELIDQTFLHAFVRDGRGRGLGLPPDRWRERLAAAPAAAAHTFDSDPGAYHDQGYYFTHLVLAWTGYGAWPLPPEAPREALRRYLERETSIVLRRTGDVDLAAEFLEGLVRLSAGGSPAAGALEARVLAAQRPDGAWGTDAEVLGDDPYDAMHGTWAAVTALAAVEERKTGGAGCD